MRSRPRELRSRGETFTDCRKTLYQAYHARPEVSRTRRLETLRAFSMVENGCVDVGDQPRSEPSQGVRGQPNW